jgi:hypothetical protein
MAKTLLDGVNEVLTKVRIIHGSQEDLTSLTDSPFQNYIDTTIQSWNEALDELYSMSRDLRPNVMSENTITLVTSDRDYALQTDLVELLFPLLDETNGQFIYEYKEGYMRMVNDQQIPSNYTGLPLYGVIRPTDGQLYLDRIPTANENGLQYKYRYQKDTELTAAADEFPFENAVFRALVPAVAELWKRHHRNEMDNAMLATSLGRAARLLDKIPERKSWI